MKCTLFINYFWTSIFGAGRQTAATSKQRVKRCIKQRILFIAQVDISLPAWLNPIICLSRQMNWMCWICSWVYQDKQFKYDNRVEANWGHHIWHFWDIVSRTYWLMDKVVSGFLRACKCSPSAVKSVFLEKWQWKGRNSNTFGFSNFKHIIANYIWTRNKPGRFNYSAPLLLLLSHCKSDLPPSVSTTICHH